jgi:hypothetical protein
MPPDGFLLNLVDSVPFFNKIVQNLHVSYFMLINTNLHQVAYERMRLFVSSTLSRMPNFEKLISMQ